MLKERQSKNVIDKRNGSKRVRNANPFVNAAGANAATLKAKSDARQSNAAVTNNPNPIAKAAGVEGMDRQVNVMRYARKQKAKQIGNLKQRKYERTRWGP